MRGTLRYCAGGIALLLSSPLFADSLENRVTRLERVLENRTLVEIVERIDALEREVQQLRSYVEEQQHGVDEVSRRQRQLYLDIDRRLTQLERETEGSASPAAGQATTPSGGAPPPLVTPGGSGAATAPSAAAPKDLAGEREAYQQAFDLLYQKRYDQAMKALKAFLQKYPNGRYANNAQFWIGETYYLQADYKSAVAEYQNFISRYPNDQRIAEVMLKSSYCYYELKQGEEAKAMLTILLESYPDSKFTDEANKLLGRLK